MTLKQLEAFYLAANLGSFAIAAERLHVTQSSLSKRIAELESSIGKDLFDRTSKRAQLTDAGARLLPSIAKMLELQASLRDTAADGQTLTGTCRFGISELGALTWLPALVARVRREHPELVLQPYVDLARRLEKQVVRGELDFAVVPGPAEDPQIASQTVSRLQFTWAASPNRFRASAVLAVEALEQHPIITMTEGSGLTRAFEGWATEQSVRAQKILACNSLMAIVGLTVADLGISFLPRDFVEPWVKRGSLVALSSIPPLPELNYCFMQRLDDVRPTVIAMKKHVLEAADFSASGDIPR